MLESVGYQIGGIGVGDDVAVSSPIVFGTSNAIHHFNTFKRQADFMYDVSGKLQGSH
jgi:hypothetical protein